MPPAALRTSIPAPAPLAGPRGTGRLGTGGIGPRAVILAALIAGIVIRLWLAVVNTEANDPHLPVIAIMAFEHRVPTKGDAWEGFQPKLYHATVAVVWRAMSTRDPIVLARAAQLVSCAAGILTLLVLLRFLRDRSPPGTWPGAGSAATFAFAALNPGLLGISAQATNDAFVVLFASLTLLFGVRYFATWRRGDFVAMALAAVAAGISKGNGLVVGMAVLATFAIVAARPPRAAGAPRRTAVLAHGGLFLVTVVPAIAFVGPYASLYRTFGSPFVTNWHLSPAPHLYRETLTERPGLTSIAHGLLTFRLANLVRYPTSTWNPSEYPRHRTSLWSRVYAQAHSYRFEAWPPSWASPSRTVRNLTRLLFLLGIVPVAIMGCGVRETIRARERSPATVLLALTVLGYLAFVALYSIRLRDYSSMKLIFILPALLGFSVLFSAGTERVMRMGKVPRRVATVGLGLLLAGYLVDAGMLIRDLRRHLPSARPPSLDARAGMSALDRPAQPAMPGETPCSPRV